MPDVGRQALSAAGCDEGVHMEEPEPKKQKRKYDLAERAARFAEAIIRFAMKVPRNPVTNPLIGQLVDAGTSIGANNCEADSAVSRKDFRNKIGICRKESAETKYWLRMIVVAAAEMKDEARPLWREAHELNKIYGASFTTASRNVIRQEAERRTGRKRLSRGTGPPVGV